MLWVAKWISDHLPLTAVFRVRAPTQAGTLCELSMFDVTRVFLRVLRLSSLVKSTCELCSCMYRIYNVVVVCVYE